ncbi:mobile mystery protein A [Xanthobacter dioxanivorans]|uniref:Mobile mystery protein A n=1 Tax=Xanthobacter dioxanivorans TaxID=2528964 RepID=A0A974PP36_9HYPH|nr:mobile mystery protein A [Xanthobacter dioxanivorans]QRG06876.1 mobile mystery protein A [Xanthobacter dioxanivorans]
MRTVIRQKARQRLDERLLALKPVDHYRSPPKGWLKAIRDALGMTGVQFARRLNVSPQSVDALEKSEANGTIKIKTLRRAAEALDCTLVYALVPNTSLEAAVNEQARALALRDLDRVAHTMKLEAQGVPDADLAERLDAYIRDSLRDRDIWEPS